MKSKIWCVLKRLAIEFNLFHRKYVTNFHFPNQHFHDHMVSIGFDMVLFDCNVQRIPVKYSSFGIRQCSLHLNPRHILLATDVTNDTTTKNKQTVCIKRNEMAIYRIRSLLKITKQHPSLKHGKIFYLSTWRNIP